MSSHPSVHGDAPLPVTVTVHGGAYTVGSSATVLYDGAGTGQGWLVVVCVSLG